MKILHVTNDFTDEVGGLSRHVDELTRCLARHARIHIAYLCRSGEASLLRDEWGRTVQRIPHRGQALERALRGVLLKPSELGGEGPPDIVHVHTPIEALTIRVADHTPTVYTQHSSVLDRWLEVPVLRQLTRKRLERFSRVIAVSESVASKLSLTNCVVIPNGVDGSWPVFDAARKQRARAEIFSRIGRADPGGLLAMFVGRLVENKGLEPFLRANRSLLRGEGTNLTLLIAGDGPRRSAIDALIGESLRRAVVVGPIEPEKIASFYGASDLCVIPSTREPFGIVALEAMASGSVPVVSPTGGLVEVVKDGLNGYHLGRDLELEPVLERYRQRDAEQMAAAGSRTARERFSWDSVADRTLQQYRSLQPKSGARS
jgi:glycosyltransferase involved in cell wall biosynthesis